MIERKNDWFATQLNLQDHPEVTEFDLYANGITPDNTGIKDKDYYRNIPRVQETFTKDGQFDEKAFDNFYESALRTYNEYSNDKFIDKILDSFGTSPYDITLVSNPNQNVIKTGTILTNFHDRNRHSYGLGNLWEMGDPNFSDREVAQTKNVRDVDGTILDWTPNDKGGLIKGLFRPSIVMASYDEDVYDENGVLIHQKGELKLDENGDPYPEILGDRDSYGKQIFKYSDTLTIEGTKLNNWDPFDSDGLNKSIGSTIAKTALTLAPFFIPTVGPVLGSIAALTGIASSLPVLAKSVDSLFTGNDNDEFAKSMTRIENYFNRFGGATSDNGRNNFFSAENIGNIISTSAGQLFSQRFISDNSVKLLSKIGANTNKKLGQQLSLGYMALTSAADTYGDFKEAGASDQLAGLGMIATTLGFYGLMNVGYFKDKLFEGSLLDENQQIRRVLRDLAMTEGKLQFGDDFGKVTFKPGGILDKMNKSDSNIAHFLSEVVRKSKEIAKKLPVGKAGGLEASFVSRSMNEGVEEWIEEVMQDSVKALAKGFEALGFNVTEENIESLDFNFDPADMLKRWGAAMLGGAIGGATFELFNQMDLVLNPEMRRLQQMPSWQRMAYDLQDEDNLARYKAALKKMSKHGYIGDENLSATEYDPVTNLDNSSSTKIAYKQGTSSNNQNRALTSWIESMINQTYNVLHEEGLISNSQNLVYQALSNPKLQDDIKKSGLSYSEYWKKNGHDVLVDALHEMGAFDIVFKHARSLGQQIYNTKLDLQRYENQIAKDFGLDKINEIETELKKHEEYKFLQEKLKNLKELYNDIISGNRSDDYMGYAHFILDDSPMKYYLNLFNNTVKTGDSLGVTTVENYAKTIYNIDYNSLKEDSNIKQYIDSEFKNFQTKNENSYWDVWQFHRTLSDQKAEQLNKANELLKKAKLDPFHSDTIVGELLDDAKESLRIFDQQLEERKKILNSEAGEELSSEELNNDVLYKTISDAKSDMESKINFYSQFGLNIRLNQLFNPEGFVSELGEESVFNPKARFIDMQSNMFSEAKDKVKSYYQYLKDNNVILRSKDSALDYLSEFTLRLPLSFDIKDLNKILNQNTIPKELVLKLAPDTKGLESWPDLIDHDSFADIVVANLEYFNTLTGSKSADIIDSLDEIWEYFNKPASELLHSTLESDINSLITLIRTNPAEALNKYNELINLLNPYMDFINIKSKYFEGKVFTTEEFIDHIALKDSKLMDFISDIIKDVDSLTQSPIYDLLSDLSVTLSGENNKIIDLLKAQRDTLANLQDTTEFTLNSSMKQALDDAQVLLNILTALIDSAYDNINMQVNKYREGLNKSKLAEIDENTKQILVKDIKYLQTQIDYLKSLGGMNLEKAITVQQDIMKFDSVQRVKFFVEPPEEFKPLVNSIAKILGNDENYFSSIWGNENFDVTDENFNQKYQAILNFENILYDDFSKLDKKGILEKIIDEFLTRDDLLSANAGLLSDNPNNEFTAYGMLRYLMMNLLNKSTDVLGYYKGVVESSKFAPFYSQELIIKDAWSQFHNKEYYNLLLRKIKEKANNTSNPFIKNSEILDNFLFINGVPGSGKTAVISNLLIKMLEMENGNKSDVEIVPISITTEQTNKLATSIDKSNIGINWKVVLNNITLKDGSTTFKDGHQVVSDFMPKTDHDALFKTKAKLKLVVFDEITLAKESDLLKYKQYIDALLKTDPEISILTIGLGDLNQASASEIYKNEEEVSLTNLLYNSSFRLITSLRETNQGKQDNTQSIFNVVNAAQQEFYKNRAYNLAEANDKIKEVLTHPKTLKWYESNTGIYGDKFINSTEVDAIISKLKKFGDDKSIAIIVSDEESTEPYKEKYRNDKNIRVLTKTEAQGGEYDYVIADTKLNSQDFLRIKEFYTLMSRARNATFFTEKSIILGISSNDKPSPEAGVILKTDNEAQEKVYDKYRQWRMELIKDIRVPESGEKPKPEIKPIKPPVNAPKPFEQREIEEKEELEKAVSDAIQDLSEDTVNSRDKIALEKRRNRSGENSDYISIESGDCDGEVFYEWLANTDISKLGRSLLSSEDWTEEKIAEYKRYVKYASSAILEGLREDNLKYALGEFVDFNDFTEAIVLSLSDKSLDSYYYITELDNSKSLLYYCFNVEDIPYAVPIAVVRGDHKGKFKELIFNKDSYIEPIFISSNGKVFRDIDSLSEKISFSNILASFLGAKNLSVTSSQRKWSDFSIGKTFLVTSLLNSSIENLSGVIGSDIQSYLTPHHDGKSEIDWFVDEDLPFRLIGVQHRLSFDDLVNICNLIKTANSNTSGQIEGAVQEAITKLRTSYGIDYIPYRNQHLLVDENVETEDSDKEKAKPTNLRLMTGDRRLEFVNIFNRYFEQSSLTELITSLDFSGKDVIFKIALWRPGHKSKDIYYLKADGNDGFKFIGLDGNDLVGVEPVKVSLGFGSIRESLYGDNGIITKALENLAKAYPNNSLFSNINDLYEDNSVYIDYCSGKQKEEGYKIYDANLSSIIALTSDEHFIGTNTNFKYALESSEAFKHGIYINILGSVFLNSKDGANDAIWATTEINKSWRLQTDILKIFAPVYQLDLNSLNIETDTSNNDLDISTNTNGNISGETRYTLKDDVYIFDGTIVSKSWLNDNLESKQNLPTGTEFKLKKIDLNKNTITIISSGGIGHDYKLKPDFDFNKNFSNFTQNLPHVALGGNFYLNNGILQIKVGDKQFDIEILGSNDNYLYYKYNNNLEVSSLNISGRDEIIKRIPKSIQSKGYALGYYNNGLVFVKNTPQGDTFYYDVNGITTKLQLQDNKLIGNNISINLSDIIAENYEQFKTHNLDRVETIKNSIKQELIRIPQIPAIVDINIDGFNNSNEVIEYINALLNEHKYEFNTGKLYEFDDVGKLHIKDDIKVLIGSVIYQNELKNGHSPKIENLDVKNYNSRTGATRYEADVIFEDGTFKHLIQLLTWNNGMPQIENISSEIDIQSKLDEVIIFVEDNFPDFNISDIKEYFNSLLKQDNNEEVNNAYNDIIEELINDSSNEAMQLSEMLNTLEDSIRENCKYGMR